MTSFCSKSKNNYLLFWILFLKRTCKIIWQAYFLTILEHLLKFQNKNAHPIWIFKLVILSILLQKICKVWLFGVSIESSRSCAVVVKCVPLHIGTITLLKMHFNFICASVITWTFLIDILYGSHNRKHLYLYVNHGNH